MWTTSVTGVDIIENIETKLSACDGALSKLSKYLPFCVLVPVYYSLVYSHLQNAIMNGENFAKPCTHKIQVTQNRIVKILCKRFGRKNRLLSQYKKFNSYELIKSINF